MVEDPIIVNVCKLYNHIQDASSDILNLYTIKCTNQLASEVSLHLQLTNSGHHLQLRTIVIVTEESRLNKHDSANIVHNNLSGKIVISAVSTIELLLWFRLRSLYLVSGPINCRYTPPGETKFLE
jgi:hypothetical protein